jgi:polyhydroxyalkanoate synthesis regulator phasin
MTTATLEFSMPEALSTGAGLWGTIAAGITAAVAILYTLVGNLKKNSAENDTETEALRMVSAAVEHWKGLYDVLLTQVQREREQREAAEQRAMLAINEVEGLRGEVAALKRQIDQLSATINKLTGAQV